MWHKSIRPEDCVQDIPPCFSDIEVWLFDYPLPKTFFLTHKNKGFRYRKTLDLRNLQLQCVSAKYAQYMSIPATKLGQVKIQLLSKLHAKTFFLTLIKRFPLQGERAQSLKVYNIRMSVFKNNIIEMRKRR